MDDRVVRVHLLQFNGKCMSLTIVPAVSYHFLITDYFNPASILTGHWYVHDICTWLLDVFDIELCRRTVKVSLNLLRTIQVCPNTGVGGSQT